VPVAFPLRIFRSNLRSSIAFASYLNVLAFVELRTESNKISNRRFGDSDFALEKERRGTQKRGSKQETLSCERDHIASALNP